MGSPSPTSTYAISRPRTLCRFFGYGNAAEIIFAPLVVVVRRDMPSSADRHVAIEEGADHGRHHVQLLFQREMAGVEQVELRLREISEVGRRARSREDLVV